MRVDMGSCKPLERGDLRLLVLAMLKEPMHGYEIISRLKESSGGRYRPSTGALYPQLRGLEEAGLVKCEETDGRKNYVLTKKGEEYLNKNGKLVGDAKQRFRDFWRENDLGKLVEQIAGISKILMAGSARALESGMPRDKKRIDESKRILSKAEGELKSIWV